MPNQTLNFSNATTPEGRQIAALTGEELAEMEYRCANYAAQCEAVGREPRADYAFTCAAVTYEVNRRAARSGSISEAFSEFSELCHQARAVGYAVPSIAGTPPCDGIDDVCALLREALRAAEPLPGEPGEVTRRITEAYRAEIDAAITALNAPVEAKQRH